MTETVLHVLGMNAFLQRQGTDSESSTQGRLDHLKCTVSHSLDPLTLACIMANRQEEEFAQRTHRLHDYSISLLGGGALPGPW